MCKKQNQYLKKNYLQFNITFLSFHIKRTFWTRSDFFLLVQIQSVWHSHLWRAVVDVAPHCGRSAKTVVRIKSIFFSGLYNSQQCGPVANMAHIWWWSGSEVGILTGNRPEHDLFVFLQEEVVTTQSSVEDTTHSQWQVEQVGSTH